MAEKIIDGNAIAASIRVDLKERIERMGRVPGLAVILVGGRRDSATYVKMKKKACAEVGITSFGIDYTTDVTENELLEKSKHLINRFAAP
jgi:5,10-methylene-tetrahydrofolate dehydrogenase/methenyl tetrahydrofolate cyclohydrolase